MSDSQHGGAGAHITAQTPDFIVVDIDPSTGYWILMTSSAL